MAFGLAVGAKFLRLRSGRDARD